MRVFVSLSVFCLATSASLLQAETVLTDPVGTVTLAIKGNSDTVLAVPLTSTVAFVGKVSTTAAAGTNLLNIVPTGTPGFTANQYAGKYYVRVSTGAKAGMFYTVTANTTGQLTVDTAGDTATLASGDGFQVLKYWTLGTLFPAGSGGTVANPLTASATAEPTARTSQVLLPDNTSTGINLPPAATYYFTSAGWFSAVGNVAADDTLLYPDTYFIVRQPATVSTDVNWTVQGNVAMTKLATPLTTQATAQQDNFVGLPRPVDLTLATSGLENGFTESTGLAAFARKDLLLVYNNAQATFNKAAAKTFFRYNGNWYQATTGSPVANNEPLPAGAGFVVRKAATVGAPTAVWTNTASY